MDPTAFDQSPTLPTLAPTAAVANSRILDRLAVRYFVTAPDSGVLGRTVIVQPPAGTVDLAAGVEPDGDGAARCDPRRGGPSWRPAVAVASPGSPFFAAGPGPRRGRHGPDRRRAHAVLDGAVGTFCRPRRRERRHVARPRDGPADGSALARRTAGRIALGADAKGDPALGLVLGGGDGLAMVRADGAVVYERKRALPRIRWASHAEVIRDPAARIDALRGPIPPDTVVLSRQGPPGSGEPAQLEVLQDDPERIRVAVDAAGNGYVVIADALQDGWRAEVDGAPAPLVDADHAGVAVFVPGGPPRGDAPLPAAGLEAGARSRRSRSSCCSASAPRRSLRRRRRPRRRGGPAGGHRASALAMKGIPRAVWLITAVFGLLLLSYSVLFPIYRAPDEVNHVDMIWGIRNERRYPNFDTRSFSADVFASRAVARVDAPFHRLAAEAIPRGQRPTFAQLAPYGPTTYRNQVAQHPPLYYALLAAPLFATPSCRWPATGRSIRWSGFLRFLSVLLDAPAPANRVPSRPGGSTGPSPSHRRRRRPPRDPQLVHIGAAVNNDDLLTLLFGLLTAVLVSVGHRVRALVARPSPSVSSEGSRCSTKGFALVRPGVGRRRLRAGTGAIAGAGPAGEQAVAALALMTAIGGWWWILQRRSCSARSNRRSPSTRRGRGSFPTPLVAPPVRAEHGDHVLEPGRGSRRSDAAVLVERDGDRGLADRRRAARSSGGIGGARLPWGDPLLLCADGRHRGDRRGRRLRAEYAKIGLTPGLQGRYLFPGVASALSVAFAAGAGAVLAGERYLPGARAGRGRRTPGDDRRRILRAYLGSRRALLARDAASDAMLAWSPWPSPAVIGGVAAAGRRVRRARAATSIRQTQDVARRSPARLARLAVQRVLPLPAAVLLELDPVAVVHPVLHRVVVAAPALGARERDLRAVAFLLRHRV